MQKNAAPEYVARPELAHIGNNLNHDNTHDSGNGQNPPCSIAGVNEILTAQRTPTAKRELARITLGSDACHIEKLRVGSASECHEPDSWTS